MAETALKFGPEWLRNLSDGNPTNSQLPNTNPIPAPRHKLADYRYGKEEMLALFTKTTEIPENIKEISPIASELCQVPLAFTSMRKDELDIWAVSVNSDVTQRVIKSGAPPSSGLIRMRGGTVERGRGSTRGRGSFYQRGSSFDDIHSDGRPRGFDRDDRDRKFDRTYPDHIEENGLGKRELYRTPSEGWGIGSKDRNSSKFGWRSENARPNDNKWGSSNNAKGSWRSNKEADQEERWTTVPGKDSRYPNKWSEEGGDNLPEWSTETQCNAEKLGTFDSAGAFMENKQELPTLKDPNKITRIPESKVPSVEIETSNPTLAKPVPPAVTESKQVDKTAPPVEVKASSPPREKPPNDQGSPNSKMAAAMLEATQRHGCVPFLVAKADAIPRQASIVRPTSVPQALTHPAFVISHQQQSALKNDPTSIHHPMVTETIQQKPSEDENFALLEKTVENMMEQWTAEEEQPAKGQSLSVERTSVLPVHHEEAYKWFYKDPQGAIQGPFTATDMMDWFCVGYFTVGLLVRRGCDERFAQLGELIKTWGRVPFKTGPQMAPLRVESPHIHPPNTLTHPAHAAEIPTNNEQQMRLLLLHQQQQQQQQKMLYKQQYQAQQILGQLKQSESFTSLNPEQQRQVLTQNLLAQQQILRTPTCATEIGERIPQVPLLGMNPMLNREGIPPAMWGMPAMPTIASMQPMPKPVPWQPSNSIPGSIWDLEMSNQPEIQQQKDKRDQDEKRKELEYQLHRLMEEQRQRTAEREEQRRVEEELLRKKKEVEEERRKLEDQKQKEEEQKREEEMLRKQREEEEYRQLQERLLELSRQEELRKRGQEELLKQQEQLKVQEELFRKQQEEIMRIQEEERRRMMDEEHVAARRKLREKEEQKGKAPNKGGQEEGWSEVDVNPTDWSEFKGKKKKDEIERQKRLLAESEHQRKVFLETERLQQQLVFKQQQGIGGQDIEVENFSFRQKQEETVRKLQEQQNRKSQVAAWLSHSNPIESANTPSLSQIQKMEKETLDQEMAQRLEVQQLERENELQLLRNVQSQQSKNAIWAQKSSDFSSVKTLEEIQREEAEKAAKEEKLLPKVSHAAPSKSIMSGVWNNAASNLTWASSTNCTGWSSSGDSNPPARGGHVMSSSKGFWDDAVSVIPDTLQTTKSASRSAFPTLDKPKVPQNSATSNKTTKAIRAKKDEEAVMKLFEMKTLKNPDEFTQWCASALSSMGSPVDIPTFIAFLVDVESPYEVHDYVRSYLGEGKESREFAKQFLERRLKSKQQKKQALAESAPPPKQVSSAQNAARKPAATNFTNSRDFESETGGSNCVGDKNSKAKKKKAKRMQKVDTSLLGFTVQGNPDRFNVGEIEQIEARGSGAV